MEITAEVAENAERRRGVFPVPGEFADEAPKALAF
jgi:hypothetical protein